MTRDPLVIVATLSLAGLALFFLVEHAPKWLRALASSKPFDGIRTALAPIALPGWIKAVAFLAWSALLLTLLAGMFFVILTGLAKLPGITPETAPDLRWYLLTLTAITAALGAIIALPFTLRRTVQNERQTRTAEEGYVTQQINDAVANLAAHKEVNKLGRNLIYEHDGQKKRGFAWYGEDFQLPQDEADSSLPIYQSDGEWKNVALTEPNIEVRIGAILALERLARQRANDAKGTTARTSDGILDHEGAGDHVRIMEILCAYIRENAPASGAKDRTWQEGEGTPNLDEWIEQLSPPRTDIQTALRVLGRRTCDQRACEGHQPKDVNHHDLQNAGELWHGARLDLRDTNLQASYLAHENARPMNLCHADLTRSRMEGANLAKARLMGAKLHRAQMQAIGLVGAQMQRADLKKAQLERAELAWAEMQGADLSEAQMQRADLWGAQFDEATTFRPATLRGAGLKVVDLSMLALDPDILAGAFGDATVTLPDGLATGTPPLAHWSTEDLEHQYWDEDNSPFHIAWRAFQATLEKQSKDPD
ncbi:MAG: pentapeptide repeat-containing protein [Rhodobacteraceae bacterium]|nr:pentapeptide repeat-containing protein [Paracoccaceae bacterium]